MWKIYEDKFDLIDVKINKSVIGKLSRMFWRFVIYMKKECLNFDGKRKCGGVFIERGYVVEKVVWIR